MAATPEGAAVTLAKQRAQLAVARAVQAETALLWLMLDPERLDATRGRWLAAQLRAVESGRETAARNAHRFYRQFAQADGRGLPPDMDVPRVNNPAESAAVLTSLEVTGPVRAKQGVAQGLAPQVAMEAALQAVTGSTQRHVLNGGRDAELALMRADPGCDRYARITHGNSCAFCGMLAARGPVYVSEATAAKKVHDGCDCGVEPVFDVDAWNPPSGTKEWQSRWREYADTLPPGQRLSPQGFQRFVRANRRKPTAPRAPAPARKPAAPQARWNDDDLSRRTLRQFGDDRWVEEVLATHHVFTDGRDVVRFPKVVKSARARWDPIKQRLDAQIAETQSQINEYAARLAEITRRADPANYAQEMRNNITILERRLRALKAERVRERGEFLRQTGGRVTDDLTAEDKRLAPGMLADLADLRPRLPKWRQTTRDGTLRPFDMVIDTAACDSIGASAFTYLGSKTVWFRADQVFLRRARQAPSGVPVPATGHMMPVGRAGSKARQLMAHEFGHMTDLNSMYNRETRAELFARFKGSPWVSKYGNTNDREMYAECFSEWVYGDRKNPAVAAFAKAFRWDQAKEAQWARLP